ncbi:Sec-independent protein translocase subunit TatA [Aeromicrobium sp. CF4.19]|uniref:Sec-independent protein translocase subunit TatA n=1 Tax=Aeromicrobium sp. CF4.19 TaxID=3373082 RepID=UPI003EE6E388
MFRGIGPTEILLILGVVLLLFGGRKLPELARGSGRALRIFKSEVQEMQDDEKDGTKKDDTAKDDRAPDALESSEEPTPATGRVTREPEQG